VTAIEVTIPLRTDASWERAVAGTYDRHIRRLWEYGRRLGHDSAQAEDIAHEAFARLLSLPERRRPTNPAGWLYRAVHNYAVDEHRRRRPNVVREIAIEAVPVAQDVAARVALWDLVDRLPPRQRAAVFLRFRADLDYITISQVLGIGEAGARANVFRGMESLRKAMVTK
jgi:RNA polymerase sigma factor (sigma-70 family)